MQLLPNLLPLFQCPVPNLSPYDSRVILLKGVCFKSRTYPENISYDNILQVTEATKELLENDGGFTYVERDVLARNITGIVTYWLLGHESNPFISKGNSNAFSTQQLPSTNSAATV